MTVKGISLKSAYNYVKSNHPDQLDRWLDSLQDNHKAIYSNPIIITDWYPIEFMIEPLKKIAELFFNGDLRKCGRELGRSSADYVLKGVYKAFLQITTPGFLMKRADKILSAYYNDAEMKVIEYSSNYIKIRFTKLPTKESLLEYNICGWMEMALEKVGCKDIKIVELHTMAKGDLYSEYDISWT